ncbi:hypothetical protein WMY93_004906 [Mugilogobius chulae]|uniref:Inositol polyphosphate-related phosphatase domain-containing protein n=1 Tax=Mugilogobius chulae TaxID=88201 RepID=A0AAW0Q4W6_9GOBI
MERRLLLPYEPSRTLRSSGSRLLVIPKVRTHTHGEASFQFYGPRLWNSLPEDLRAAENIQFPVFPLRSLCTRSCGRLWLLGSGSWALEVALLLVQTAPLMMLSLVHLYPAKCSQLDVFLEENVGQKQLLVAIRDLVTANRAPSLDLNARAGIAQLRTGTLPLAVEVGRFKGILEVERICSLCDLNVVEDEQQSLTWCRGRGERSSRACERARPGTRPGPEQTSVPPRPRRPQRSARVEGSVDISELKERPAAEESPSRPKPPRPAPIRSTAEHSPPPGFKPGPKAPGHHHHQPVRAASVPDPPLGRHIPPHLNPHAHRALSVAGTADTQAQTVEDFRQVSPSHTETNELLISEKTFENSGRLNLLVCAGLCRLHVITWNVGSAQPPDDITSLLGLNVGDGNTDMYIIGLQEWSEVCMERLSPFGYVLVTSQRMQGVLLLVFAKYFHLPFLRGVQTETTRTGLGGYWGNKGGVSARMSVFGHTICFLNCHLPAHMENSEQRMEDFESILQQQQFEGQAATGVLDHDVVFWFGDLNFRIDDLEMQVVKSAIDNNKYTSLWDKDQLNLAKDSETVLEGFQEGPLKFPPTYKFDVGTDTYDTSGKKRKPAWTDRILWRLRATAPLSAAAGGKRASVSGLTSGTRVTQHCYRSHMEYTVSDHKPVSAIFTLQFPYRVDMPLVTLIVEDEWNSISDATAKFKLAPNYSRSSWDWIGLYKVGFKHHKDYVGYVWAKQEENDFHRQEHQVAFTEEELPKDSGDFILGYYSNNMNSIVGVTEPFQIQLPSLEPRSSSSDSSDFSSEEDSTVVQSKAGSRSSSPHGRTKAKQHHHHRRHRSPGSSGGNNSSPEEETPRDTTTNEPPCTQPPQQQQEQEEQVKGTEQ